MPGTTPSQPGWYPDGDGGERWYDGNGWTDHVRGLGADQPAGPPADEPLDEATVVVPTTPTGELPVSQPNPLGAPQLGVGRGGRIAAAVGAVLLLIAIAVVAGIILLGRDDKAKDRTKDDRGQTVDVDPTGKVPSTLDLPTIDPSDFPTDFPAEIPTIDRPDLPDLPSGVPTDFPDLPSSFPTDPEGWDEWFSDYLEQVNP